MNYKSRPKIRRPKVRKNNYEAVNREGNVKLKELINLIN